MFSGNSFLHKYLLHLTYTFATALPKNKDAVLVIFQLLGCNTKHSQVEGQKVHSNSQFVEVSVHSVLASTQASWHGAWKRTNSPWQAGKEAAASLLLSLLIATRLSACWMVASHQGGGYLLSSV